jgi:hypothetical protein
MHAVENMMARGLDSSRCPFSYAWFFWLDTLLESRINIWKQEGLA